jgi:hypothetical protein
MRHIRLWTGIVTLLALASAAVADAPARVTATGSVAECSLTGGACPLGSCPQSCPIPCAEGGQEQASPDVAR